MPVKKVQVTVTLEQSQVLILQEIAKNLYDDNFSMALRKYLNQTGIHNT
jgi:hypothetical protein